MTDPRGPRYAIYFTPEPTSGLWRFGSVVLGYDSVTGREVAPDPSLAALKAALPQTAFARPSRYGFHATLKAPFELAAGQTPQTLLSAARAFAAGYASVALDGLSVRCLGSFVALVESRRQPAVNVLAAACVRTFEPFRAPLSPADLARRQAVPLSDRHKALLAAWGYPYVLDAFRFHMTLTGALSAADLERAADALAGIYAPDDGPVAVDAISVLEQPDRSARFRVLERFPLSG